MKLTDILTDSRIDLDLTGDSKNEIIERLVDLVVRDLGSTGKDPILDAVLAREDLMSTGVGNGVAIPHGKTESVDSLIAAFGRCPVPVEFEALDGQPVSLVFLLVGPEDAAGPHIKALSRISRLLSYEEFRTRLANAGTTAEILETITEEEEQYFELKG
jgi:mannitol/fructose-specific phosphotransferase system IIA component (Ntr-type)